MNIILENVFTVTQILLCIAKPQFYQQGMIVPQINTSTVVGFKQLSLTQTFYGDKSLVYMPDKSFRHISKYSDIATAGSCSKVKAESVTCAGHHTAHHT